MQTMKLDSPAGLSIYHSGPPLDRGPLPAFFYFALSGSESLDLNPFNQAVTFLDRTKIRVFSFSLPGHEAGGDHKLGMIHWAEGLQQSPSYLEEFLQRAVVNVDYLIAKGWIDPRHIAAGGLSRGGFIATHLAARHPDINTVVGYSPLTALRQLNEFSKLTPHLLHQINLENQIPKLLFKSVRYYIGNRDIRVGTPICFDFIYKLTEAAYHNGLRSPNTELIIYPSIGHKGHGTPPSIFEAGAQWLSSQLVF